jgi:hypothetical protein
MGSEHFWRFWSCNGYRYKCLLASRHWQSTNCSEYARVLSHWIPHEKSVCYNSRAKQSRRWAGPVCSSCICNLQSVEKIMHLSCRLENIVPSAFHPHLPSTGNIVCCCETRCGRRLRSPSPGRRLHPCVSSVIHKSNGSSRSFV